MLSNGVFSHNFGDNDKIIIDDSTVVNVVTTYIGEAPNGAAQADKVRKITKIVADSTVVNVVTTTIGYPIINGVNMSGGQVARDAADGVNVYSAYNYSTVSSLAPVTAFSGNVLIGPAPLTVIFTDSTTNTPTFRYRDFGDGFFSTEQNPTHIYKTPGIYTVVLTTSNGAGTNILTQAGYITAL